jgi:sigma-B regulation protein RsbQ
MIGVLAHNAAPEVFTELVLIGPSPRYVDDEGYTGGFSREEIEGLLDTLEANYLGWSATMAPVIMGVPERPELAGELDASFCRTDPDIAASFARATFLADNRADLDAVRARTLVVQCSQDAIASEAVGEYVHARIAGSEYVLLDATGHCPHLSAPEETIVALQRFLA